MDIQTQTPDSLDISLVKSHLYVDFNDDDTLIQHYIDASLTASELYLHKGILYTVYENTADEIIPSNNIFTLRMPYKPEKVTLALTDLSTVELYKDEYTFDVGNSKLYISDVYEDNPVLEILTTVGTELNANPSLDQARMLMVGDWYAFREANSNLNLREFSTSAKFLLDSLEDSVW